MARWCLDREQTARSGRFVFRLPYPGGSWYAEQAANELPMRAMAVALQAGITFGKPAESWTAADDDFFLWMKRNGRYLDLLETPRTDWSLDDVAFMERHVYQPWWP